MKLLLVSPVALSTIVVNPLSVAISMSYIAPAPPLDHVKVAPGSTPAAAFVGEVRVALAGVGLITSRVMVLIFVTELDVPIISIEYEPAIAGVNPLIVICTGVPSLTADVGLNVTVEPTGVPVAENVVV